MSRKEGQIRNSTVAGSRITQALAADIDGYYIENIILTNTTGDTNSLMEITIGSDVYELPGWTAGTAKQYKDFCPIYIPSGVAGQVRAQADNLTVGRLYVAYRGAR